MDLDYNKKDEVIKNVISVYEKSKEDFVLKALQHHGFDFVSVNDMKEHVQDFHIIQFEKTKNVYYKSKLICCFIDDPIVTADCISFKGKIL